jgi:hypothetical protein
MLVNADFPGPDIVYDSVDLHFAYLKINPLICQTTSIWPQNSNRAIHLQTQGGLLPTIRLSMSPLVPPLPRRSLRRSRSPMVLQITTSCRLSRSPSRSRSSYASRSSQSHQNSDPDAYTDDNSLEEVEATLNDLDDELDETEDALAQWSRSSHTFLCQHLPTAPPNQSS